LEQIAALWRQNVFELVNDMNKMLKLNSQQQIAIALACFLSSNKKTNEEGAKMLRKSLQEYYSMGKVQIFPDHLQHLLICIVRTNTEFKVFEKISNFLKFHFFNYFYFLLSRT
jgi:hypothetical protein